MNDDRAGAPADLEQAIAEIEERLADSEDAVAILEGLSRAMFPDGPPDIDRVTWADRSGGSTIHDTDARAEARLKSAEKRFSTLIEQIPAVTFMAVLGEGDNEIYISPHIEQLLGFTQREWLDDPFLWYWQLHEDDRTKWNEEFARGCQTGGPFSAECRFYARDGSVKWIHGEARIVRDEHGRPQFLQGVAFDITEQKRAQEILLREAVDRARIEEQLEIARRVQTSILPRDVDVPGLELSYRMIPAEEVGGDYVDVHPLPDGAWIGVGDVSGHGIDAGMTMLMVQSAMAAICRGDPDASPPEVVRQLNRVLVDNIRERMQASEYVTFVVMRYTSDGRIRYSGAHLDILVRRRATGALEVVPTKGGWLGAFADIDHAFFEEELSLEDGDLVVLYTDGVTEATDASGEQCGLERLHEVVRACDHHDPSRTKDAVIDAFEAWADQQEDDVTVVAMRYDRRKA